MLGPPSRDNAKPVGRPHYRESLHNHRCTEPHQASVAPTFHRSAVSPEVHPPVERRLDLHGSLPT